MRRQALEELQKLRKEPTPIPRPNPRTPHHFRHPTPRPKRTRAPHPRPPHLHPILPNPNPQPLPTRLHPHPLPEPNPVPGSDTMTFNPDLASLPHQPRSPSAHHARNDDNPTSPRGMATSSWPWMFAASHCHSHPTLAWHGHVFVAMDSHCLARSHCHSTSQPLAWHGHFFVAMDSIRRWVAGGWLWLSLRSHGFSRHSRTTTHRPHGHHSGGIRSGINPQESTSS